MIDKVLEKMDELIDEYAKTGSIAQIEAICECKSIVRE